MQAFVITVGIIGSTVLVVCLVVWFIHMLIEEERLPWQHKKTCPCGSCYAGRMKEAVERAEYEQQQERIRDAVREIRR